MGSSFRGIEGQYLPRGKASRKVLLPNSEKYGVKCEIQLVNTTEYIFHLSSSPTCKSFQALTVNRVRNMTVSMTVYNHRIPLKQA